MPLGEPMQQIPDGLAPAHGRLWVEWVGDPDPFDDPEIEHAKLTGRIRGERLSLLERMRLTARIRHDGISIRRMVPLRVLHHGGTKGLTEVWEWGPDRWRLPATRGSYIQELTFRDVEALLQSDERHEFRLRGGTFDRELMEIAGSRIVAPARVVLGRSETIAVGQPVALRRVGA